MRTIFSFRLNGQGRDLKAKKGLVKWSEGAVWLRAEEPGEGWSRPQRGLQI